MRAVLLRAGLSGAPCHAGSSPSTELGRRRDSEDGGTRARLSPGHAGSHGAEQAVWRHEGQAPRRGQSVWQLCVHKQGTRRPERAGDSPGGTGLGPGRTARSSVPLCSRHVVARDWGHPTTSQSKKQARMETADRRCANPSRTPPRARLRNVLPSPSRSVCSLAGGHFPLLPGSCRRVQRSQQWPVGLESTGSQAREPPAPPELDPLAKGCASQTVLGPGCTFPATGAGCIGRRVGRQPGGDASEG